MKFQLIIDPECEEEVVVKVRGASELTDKIEEMVLAYGGRDFVIAESDDGMIHLPYSDIECVTVIDRKVFVIDGNGVKYRVNHRLCGLENMLPSCFIRINKSTIANERKIVRFKATFSGAVDAVFKCGYTDYISRRCLADIKRRFEK